MSKSLYQNLKEAGCTMSSYHSDLYVEDTKIARSIIKEHGANTTGLFKDRVTQLPMIEIVGAYEPFWEKNYQNINEL